MCDFLCFSSDTYPGNFRDEAQCIFQGYVTSVRKHTGLCGTIEQKKQFSKPSNSMHHDISNSLSPQPFDNHLIRYSRGHDHLMNLLLLAGNSFESSTKNEDLVKVAWKQPFGL